jgi:hypothetical protein
MIPADAPPSFDAHRETTYATVHAAAESPRALCGDVRYEHNESAYAPITYIRADIADGSFVPIGDQRRNRAGRFTSRPDRSSP